MAINKCTYCKHEAPFQDIKTKGAICKITPTPEDKRNGECSGYEPQSAKVKTAVFDSGFTIQT